MGVAEFKYESVGSNISGTPPKFLQVRDFESLRVPQNGGLGGKFISLFSNADFHFNASFTALNLAKFDAHQQHQGQDPFVFSMASVKRRALNHPLLERFIVNFDLELSLIKSHPNYSTLCDYGAIAA